MIIIINNWVVDKLLNAVCVFSSERCSAVSSTAEPEKEPGHFKDTS